MKNKNLIRSTLACGALLPLSAAAGGIGLYEIGTPDVGLASAGYASRVQDASVVFRNPAGMSFLEGVQFQAGVQLTYGSVEFSANSNTSPRLGTEQGGNAVGALPAGGFFAALPVADKVSIGFAGTSYFGLMEKYDDNWVGRYYIQEGALVGMSLLPTLSVKPTEWLSIGAGLNAMYGFLKNEVAVNNLDPRIGDGQMSLKDETWGFGANVGVMVEPVKGTRLGVTYLSAVDLSFKDRPSFSNLGPGLANLLQNPGQIDLGTTVPQSVMISLYHELSPKWSVMGDFGWQDWSRFGNIEVGLETSGISRNVNANYQDTWHGALGAECKVTEKWSITGGIAYDSSAVDSANRSVTLPMGQAWRFGIGALYQVKEHLTLGAAYEFMWGGNMSVDQGSNTSLRGRVAGSYNDTWFSFASINLKYTF